MVSTVNWCYVPQQHGLAASFDVNGVLFVQSSEFAAEWWGNIWKPNGFGMFWSFACECKAIWWRWPRTTSLRCLQNPLAACDTFASEFTLFLVYGWVSGWAWCSFSTNRLSFYKNKPTVFLPNCVLQFSESCMMFSPSMRRSWCFWEELWWFFWEMVLNSPHEFNRCEWRNN